MLQAGLPKARGQLAGLRSPSANARVPISCEWLCYARTLGEFLADLIHESDTVECERMVLSLDAIAPLVHIGAQCTAQAHARMTWERAQGD